MPVMQLLVENLDPLRWRACKSFVYIQGFYAFSRVLKSSISRTLLDDQVKKLY